MGVSIKNSKAKKPAAKKPAAKKVAAMKPVAKKVAAKKPAAKKPAAKKVAAKKPKSEIKRVPPRITRRPVVVAKPVAPEVEVIDTAKAGFFSALEFCRPGCRLSDIGHAVQTTVEAEGFGVVRDLVGHGVGSEMHEDPQIPNYGRAGHGPRIAAGMVFAIEPMITMGTYKVVTLNDGWTVVTLDRKPAAHYENTVVITEGEPELLTLYSEV